METRTRTLLKTLSWRIIAAVVTGLLGWLVTGAWEAGLTLGLVDTITKLALYYLHERAWVRVQSGYQKLPSAEVRDIPRA